MMEAQKLFGEALKRLRQERTMTQEDLAFRADVSVVYLRGLESGRFNPTLNILFSIGNALGVHPSEMLADIPIDAETRTKNIKRPGPEEGSRKKS